MLFCLHRGKVNMICNKVSLRILIDHSSIELFAEGGKLSLTSIFFPAKDLTMIRLFAIDGSIYMKSGNIIKLKSIWDIITI